ncbi:DNA gyrase subunit A [Spirochaeta isovalerica]|uniref:DNA topoisomerase (ATP-hydrolyzing) n=2 Tax=Spirochaeta isovalerica TaxID=150 RepID=A0A841RHT8_9SPIO|nr:DNA gyrase subunit A [Spirochaeta isovalerica]
MAKVAEAMLRDIKKDTIDFGPNYDDSMKEPLVLPTAFPFLLVNGASGIAVGMATNMAPHNLIEVCNAINASIENRDITSEELLECIQGPDFPQGGIIYGRKGIKDAFLTGRGKITVRARYTVEEIRPEKEAIIVTELPYMVNKATLIIKIADLVRDKRVDGISDIRDESDRNGMRIVIELKRNVSPKVTMNLLFNHTALQSNFNVNNLALVNGMPKLCTLKDMLDSFIEHRFDVITRRTKFDLKKAKEREHILEGLKIALDNIDEVIQIIKSSSNVNIARANLMARFSFSEEQSQAILDMRLQKLTSLETQKIIDELIEIRELIAYLEGLLADDKKILDVIKEETTELSEKYGDERRTEILNEEINGMIMEDLIEKEDVVVLISNRGFIKRVPLTAYKEQARGGKGSNSTVLKDDDYVEHIFIANTHDKIMFVTTLGKAYWLKVYEIPEGTRGSRGKHLKTIFEFLPDEDITTTVQIDEFSEDTYLFMATEKAVVKRVSTYAFRNAKTRGIAAIILDEGDKLIKAELTTGDDDVMLFTRNGKGLRFHEESVRAMGRQTHGVRGIKLSDDDDILVGVSIKKENEQIFMLSEYGFGKRTEFDDFNPHGRGTQGQKAYNVTDKTGKLISAITVNDTDSLVCMTSQGKTIKLSLANVSILGRNALGVKIVNVAEDDSLVGVARAENDKVDPEEGAETAAEIIKNDDSDEPTLFDE